LFLKAVLLAGVSLAHAGNPTPGFNYKIPESIMTPDKVQASIGINRWL